MMKNRWIWFANLVVLAFALVVAGGTAVLADEGHGDGDQPIAHELLAAGMPVDAPGKVLQLERYTLVPGAEIPTHIHPGAYAIFVQSGMLEFTVLAGEAWLTRAGSQEAEVFVAGQQFVAQAGDAVFENGGVVHSAANGGDEPLVLVTAALLTAGEPPLVPSDEQGTPVS